MTLGGSNSDSVAGDLLRAFIERVERMQEERKAISDDIAEIYAEAKGNGYDTKVIRQIVRIRAQDQTERMEQEALLELYMAALGMQAAPRDEDYEPHAPARAPAREIIEEFPPTDHSSDLRNMVPEPPGGPTAGEGSDALPADTVFPGVEHVSPETPSLSEAVHDANEGGRHEALTPLQLANGKPDADTGAAANVIENDGKDRADGQGISSAVEPGAPPLSIAAAAILARRPWCLHAHNTNKCGGYGKQHCGPCLKAHADDVGETA